MLYAMSLTLDDTMYIDVLYEYIHSEQNTINSVAGL